MEVRAKDAVAQHNVGTNGTSGRVLDRWGDVGSNGGTGHVVNDPLAVSRLPF